uniref:Uncharacterized protein n=1 Tax=Cacopsylla melanoneura TaxID=428564 RepID=A0A8D8XPR7_9HEMI
MLRNVHNGYSRYLTYPPLEVFITGGNNVAFVLSNTIDKTIISIGALVHAWNSFKTRILDYPQGNFVLLSELFYFTKHTVSNVRNTFCIQAVHHTLKNVQLVFDGEVDKVGIHQDMVGRT